LMFVAGMSLAMRVALALALVAAGFSWFFRDEPRETVE